MKNLFLLLLLVVFFISCKKDEAVTAANENVMANSFINDSSQALQLKIRVVWAAYSDFKDCLTGYSYCILIITDPDARITDSGERAYIDKKNKEIKDYIAINPKVKLITLGIDNNVYLNDKSTIEKNNYNKKFIEKSNFNIPQDMYIKSAVVKAASGLDKGIYIKKGSYHFENIDGILTITAPYTIAD